MNLLNYQDKSQETAIYPGQGQNAGLAYAALGLVGESGEVANKVKKVLRGDVRTLDCRGAIADEIGDILWYCAALATELGLDLDDIAQNNLDKLTDRQRRGTIQGDGDKR
jgi:NTP pyrophosphatase (non-canonical NTP hydrolase)